MQQLCDWRNRQRREEGSLSGEVEMVEAEISLSFARYVQIFQKCCREQDI